MPTLEQAEDAILHADQLVAKYHSYRRLQKVKREDGTWLIEFDVGIFRPSIVRIKLDASSGKVIEYEASQAT